MKPPRLKGEVTPSGDRVPTSSGSLPYVGGVDLFISVKAVEWVLENSKSSGNARNVLIVLAAHYREGTAWLSFESIARLANVSRPTLSKAISELEDLGELQVEREEGRVNNYSFPEFEAVKTSKVLGADQLSSYTKPVNPSLPKELVLEKVKTEEGFSLPLCQEERRELPKPVKEPKVRKGFQKTYASRPERVPPPKAPQGWVWFAKTWQRYTECLPIGNPTAWNEFEGLKNFSQEQIESRLSRWLDQRTGKITGWTALDFLRDCPLMLDEEAKDDGFPRIINEE